MSRFARARRSMQIALLTGTWICLFPPAAPAQPQGLNVSISILDPGIPADASTHRRLQVFPRIRGIESLILPFVLRESLAASNEWGAVRVVPEPDPSAELFVSGKILRSDGETLELHIHAIDASGVVWVDKVYTGAATFDDDLNELEIGARAYKTLFDEIAQDLSTAGEALDDNALRNIADISMLRYAAQLAPSAFSDFLRTAEDGTFIINRLPAENDPMLERIQRIRGVEYLMTDAVDEKFEQLHGEIASTYDIWRRYRIQFARFRAEEAERQAIAGSSAARGSYEAVERTYDNYRWARMAEQEQENWAKAFENEVGPTVTRIEARVAELDDWVDDRYAEWNRLLSEIFELETGLAD
jgi:hypothetical protein